MKDDLKGVPMADQIPRLRPVVARPALLVISAAHSGGSEGRAVGSRSPARGVLRGQYALEVHVEGLPRHSGLPLVRIRTVRVSVGIAARRARAGPDLPMIRMASHPLLPVWPMGPP